MMCRVLLLLAGFVAGVIPIHAEVIDIDNAKLAELLKQKVPIIDIRTELEWGQTGIVEGSHLITFFDFYGRYDIDAWLKAVSAIVKPEDPVILICRTGSRTASVSGLLGIREGYQTVYNVRDGITKWIRDKHPTVSPPKAVKGS